MTGGLFASIVRRKFAFLTGKHGLTTSLSGNLMSVCSNRGAPVDIIIIIIVIIVIAITLEK